MLYRIVDQLESIDILWGEELLLTGIKPTVSIGNTILPLMQESDRIKSISNNNGNENKIEISYKSEDEQVILKLIFEQIEGVLLIFVNALCKSELFKRTGYFDAYGGIRLEIEGLGQMKGLMANYLFKEWWTRPYISNDICGIPERTQSMLWHDGRFWHQALTFCGEHYKSEMAGKETGFDVILSTSDGGFRACNTLALMIGSGTNPYAVCNETIFNGMKITGLKGAIRENKRYPDFLEYLGWCSWNAFYHSVDSKGIINKAEEFIQKNIPVKWYLIDDGWSETENECLVSFTEFKDKFPDGLKGLSEELKQKYGAKWLGVWHAFTGYWDGISKDSHLAYDMKDYIYECNNGKLIPHPDASKGFGFWNTWHRWLKNQDVDFIKVDNQSFLNEFVTGNISIGKAFKGAHGALEASAGLNFDGRLLNCAGMAIEDMWNRPLTAVARNSDDFFPKVYQSFKEHAYQNAYNSIYTSGFIWGDWDMWWTQHENAWGNAVLRAVSGGPVYLSDEVGKTDKEKILPLILSDGQILRCDQPGLPTIDCLTRDPQSECIPLKIWNRKGESGVLAAFNINMEGKTVEGFISPSDIDNLKGERFVVLEYFSQRLAVINREQKFELKLSDNEVRLYQIAPVVKGVAYIGDIRKFVSFGIISELLKGEKEDIIILKEGAVFGFFSEVPPESIFVNGCESSVSEMNGLYIINCTEISAKVHIRIIHKQEFVK